jgi:hypothetical protein
MGIKLSLTIAQIALRLETSVTTVYGWLYPNGRRKGNGGVITLQAEVVEKPRVQALDAPTITCQLDTANFLRTTTRAARAGTRRDAVPDPTRRRVTSWESRVEWNL